MGFTGLQTHRVGSVDMNKGEGLGGFYDPPGLLCFDGDATTDPHTRLRLLFPVPV